MTDGARDDARDADEDRWLEARERGEPLPAIPAATAAKYARLQSLLEDLPAVPAGARLLPGWQQAVLDAIDRGEAEPAGADTASSGQPSDAARPSDAAQPSDAVRPDAPRSPGAAQVEAAQSSDAVRSIDTARPRRITKQRVAIVLSCAALAAGVVIVVDVVRTRPTEVMAELTIRPVATGEPVLAGAEELRAGSKAVVRGVVDGPGELRVYGADDRELVRCTEPGAGCTVTRSGQRTELRLELRLPVPGPLHVLLLSAPLDGPSTGRADDLSAAERAKIRTRALDATVR